MVEQAEELQALISHELRGLRHQITGERARPGEVVDKSKAMQLRAGLPFVAYARSAG